jgi:hypothetical protein
MPGLEPAAALAGGADARGSQPGEGDAMTSKEEVGKTLDELNAIRRSLQDAGLTLLKAATAAIGAAANETLTATKAVIATADDALAAAEEKVRKVRAELRKQG